MSSFFRKHLSAPGLLSIIYQQFLKIPDPREFAKNVTISITDHLMSGLAVFCLKCPSLLDYDRKRSDNVIAQNLRDLYYVNNPPSDTYIRERLDQIDQNFRREHPHLKAILVEDGLSSTAPHIRMIEEFGLKYILGAKSGDHQFLFDFPIDQNVIPMF